VAYPTDPDFQFYLTPLDIALQSALIGENDPAEALRVAANAIQSALAQAKATPTPAP
jgi:maltose-binding protein MalE